MTTAGQGGGTSAQLSFLQRSIPETLLVLGTLLVLALIGYYYYPGHTYLASDSQIYVGILEHSYNPAVLSRDLMTVNSHMGYTAYDEILVALRRITGLDFRELMQAQQFLFRIVFLFGIFLLAKALRLSDRMALLVVGILALGAQMEGPSVLTIDYEPVPRGAAIPLVFLAAGLASHGWIASAGIAGSLAFLYHPAIASPFWLVWAARMAWPGGRENRWKYFAGSVLCACAALLLILTMPFERDTVQLPSIGLTMDAASEQFQRVREAYIWVSTWGAGRVAHYAALVLLCLAAFWRLRGRISSEARFFLLGLPLVGLLSMPAVYLLIDRLKSVLAAQLQPGRAVLYPATLAGVLAAAAGVKAVRERRFAEGVVWFALPFAVATNANVFRVALPKVLAILDLTRPVIVLLLGGAAALAAWAEFRAKRWAPAAWMAAILVPFAVMPTYSLRQESENVGTETLNGLCAWANSHTPVDAVFHFADAGKQRDPGYFRSVALRAVYVEWKSAAQSVYSKAFEREWLRRWHATMEQSPPPDKETLAGLGIDYLAVRPGHVLEGERPVFENPGYAVYRIRP